jgi:hypothetical protein
MMRIAIVLVVLWLCSATLTAQSIPEWDRVYTFDESTIEMNTSLVTLISKDVSRVRFRTTFDQPQFDRGSKKNYQSQLEVMEFNCSQNQYRPFHSTYFDGAGNMVRIDDAPGQWRRLSRAAWLRSCLSRVVS